jgi:hypothetical protein
MFRVPMMTKNVSLRDLALLLRVGVVKSTGPVAGAGYGMADTVAVLRGFDVAFEVPADAPERHGRPGEQRDLASIRHDPAPKIVRPAPEHFVRVPRALAQRMPQVEGKDVGDHFCACA